MKKLRVAIYTYLIITLSFPIINKNISTASAAPSTTIQVSTPLDTLVDDGLCSLREAVRSANLNQPIGGCFTGGGGDTILIPAGIYTLEISGSDEDESLTGDLDISQGLTILGEGIGATILDGNGLDRVFHLTSTDASVVIRDLSIVNGEVEATDLLGGGGILNLGNVTIERVQLMNNTALRGGGARNSQGRMTISHSWIEENMAWSEGGGVYGDGLIFITQSTITANQAESGGGINSDETITLMDVLVSQNQALLYGGGLFNDTTANLQRVLFHANTAPNGAGIYNNHILSLTNGTFSDNISERGSTLVGRGGAIFNTAQATITNSTLFGNIAEQGGNLYNAEGGTISLQMSILASSQGGNCINLDQLISYGYNITDDSLCNLNGVGDRANTDPHLAPLADNLGATQTHALLINSPAIDYGPEEGCPTTDQRGVIRPIDGNRDGTNGCDIGAFEHAPGGILYFEPATQAYDEQAGEVELWVKRYGGDGVVSVGYEAELGSANPGSDFELNPGTLFWPSTNHTDKRISVNILDDEYSEGDEAGYVHLQNPTGQAGLLSPDDRFTLVILTNDPEGPPQPGGPIFLPLIQH